MKLEANASFLKDGNTTMAFFYCKAGKSQLFYLNHVLTWSKIGRDGRERYLSINWDLVQHGKNMGYHVETRTENISFASIQGNIIDDPVVFILWKKGGYHLNWMVIPYKVLTNVQKFEQCCLTNSFSRSIPLNMLKRILILREEIKHIPTTIRGFACTLFLIVSLFL